VPLIVQSGFCRHKRAFCVKGFSEERRNGKKQKGANNAGDAVQSARKTFQGVARVPDSGADGAAFAGAVVVGFQKGVKNVPRQYHGDTEKNGQYRDSSVLCAHRKHSRFFPQARRFLIISFLYFLLAPA
jgi:hypothetical protein